MWDRVRPVAEKGLFDSRGFTLTELLVASGFAVAVLATLYGFYRTQLHSQKSREKGIEILEEARAAMDMMVREIRNAGYWGTGTKPASCNRVAAASSTSIQIQSNLNNDTDCSDSNESTTFTFSGGEITRSGSAIAQNVVATSSSFFTYYQTGASSGFTPSTQTDRDNIKRLKISFAVQVTNPDPSVGGNLTVTLTSNTTLRN